MSEEVRVCQQFSENAGDLLQFIESEAAECSRGQVTVGRKQLPQVQ